MNLSFPPANPELWKDLFQRRKKQIRIGGYVLGGIVLLFLIMMWIDIPPMDEIENPRLDRSTQIYSADGKLIGTFYDDQNRIYVPLHKINPFVVDALIATEDIRFYEHSGIDPYSIPAVMKDLLLHLRIRGASTITMQLARNLYKRVGKEKSIFRKAKEAVVAMLLERKFTKQEILEAYLNTTSFYGDTYGIENAAQTLFGKTAEKLAPEECATLVGMLKGPALFNPVKRPDTTLARRNVVLGQMVKYRYLSQERADSLRKLPLKLNFTKGGAPTTTLAPYFKDFVKSWIRDWMKDQGKEYDLYTDGLKVYTTLDSRMQAHAEKAVEEHMKEHQKLFDKEFATRKKKPWDYNKSILSRALENTDRYKSAIEDGVKPEEALKQFDEKQKMKLWTWAGWVDTVMTPKDSLIHYLTFLQTGFMAMDPHNGYVKAWVGGINYRLFKYDHVFQAKRQVGSTFKPFVYGLAADEEIMKPCDECLDVPVTLDLGGGKTWTPQNSSGGSAGLVPFKTALALSINQCTALLMKNLGPDGPQRLCNFARLAGIESKMDCVPSLCLGTTDLSVFEMVTAYSTFVNHGIRNKPTFITRIEDRFGNVLVEFKPEGAQVIDPKTAYTVTSLLVNNVNEPTGTAHALQSRFGLFNALGGKTGTTQENSDGWFMGITPDLVGGVWVGCEERNIHFISTSLGQGARAALPVWGGFLRKVYNDAAIRFPRGVFIAPDGYDVRFDCAAPDTTAGTEDPPWMKP